MIEKRKFGLFFGVVVLILVMLAAIFLPNVIRRQLYPLKYQEYVQRYAAEYQLDPYFIYAVIRSESRFDPDAVSHVGASGLMQLMPDTFLWIKTKLHDTRDLTYETDVFDPEINIQYGSYLLHLLTEEFQDRDHVIMAYHAGRGNVNKWLTDPAYSENGKIHTIPFADTEKYRNAVNKAYRIYTTIYQK